MARTNLTRILHGRPLWSDSAGDLFASAAVSSIVITILSSLVLAFMPHIAIAQSADHPTGRQIVHTKFHSNYLAADRNLRVWLPPGYDSNTKRRYPVFYLHDGQNLFKGGPSFIPNQAWDADTTAAALIESGKIRPIIVVGIDNAGRERIAEYTPSEMKRYPGSGRGDLYAKLLVEELKPFIDSHYRTLKDAKNTALGGSSLGGLISLTIGLSNAKTFGLLAIVSPSAWWDDNFAVHQVEKLSDRPRLKIWLDIGTKEGEDALEGARKLHAALLDKRWKDNADLRYYEAIDAQHNEKAWSARFSDILKYLFGK